ncbi:MAG: DUF3800 domain-containing protein [Gammaproteobacteria bacterium]
MYRLYVDEVGTDALTCLDKDRHRYLSLTGIATEINHARDVVEIAINRIKAEVFDHDPDDPLILHRKDILGLKGSFQILRKSEKQEQFNALIMDLFLSADYVVITALIDKLWLLKQTHWQRNHPYHYLMEILVEKYAQFLERQNSIGDIMPESRQAKDKLLQNEFTRVKRYGTDFVDRSRVNSVIRGSKLKFRKKKDNIAGLQLCDLLAHPSHIYVRSLMGHAVNLGPFATRVADILINRKYDRSPWGGKIVGYGIKHLPQ